MSSELQPCPTCKAVICCEDNPFEFSLVKGPSYGNDQISINVECPPGFSCIPGVYTINKNQIILTVTNTDASVIRIQCCQNEIVQPIPPGSTEAEIGVIAQAMVNSCALQLAQCNSRISYGPFTYQSGPVESNGCANQGLLMGWATGTQPPLPAALFFLNGVIHMKAASFASQTGKTDATNKAQTFLNNYVTSLLFSSGAWDCGYWNTQQMVTCSDSSVVTVVAFHNFSTASQAAADAAAIAYGQSLCPATSSCASFDAMTWVLNFQNFPNPGPGTSSYSSSHGNFTVAASCGTTPAGTVSNSNVQIYGTMVYTGPRKVCILDLTQTTTPPPDGASNSSILIKVGGTTVLTVNPVLMNDGNKRIPFIIPVSVSALVEVIVTAIANTGTPTPQSIVWAGSMEGGALDPDALTWTNIASFCNCTTGCLGSTSGTAGVAAADASGDCTQLQGSDQSIRSSQLYAGPEVVLTFVTNITNAVIPPQFGLPAVVVLQDGFNSLAYITATGSQDVVIPSGCMTPYQLDITVVASVGSGQFSSASGSVHTDTTITIFSPL